MTAYQLPQPWRRALPGMAVVIAVLLFLYRQTGLGMVEIWDRSDTFAHAFVVPPIALWLIWRQREQLAAMTPKPAAIFLLPIALVALFWLLSDLVAVNSGTQLAFVALLVLSVPAVLGWPVAKAMAFPLGFLFFCVPLGEFLMPQLMQWTSDFTVAALRASGVPVFREGLQFVIPNGHWSVVEACSGIRYLIASIMVGTLFAYLNYNSLKRRWAFVGVAIALPLVANWIRAYMIVMIGHLSDNRLATGVDHLVYGWVFFGVVMLALFMIGARWADPVVSSAHPPVAGSLPGRSEGPRWLVVVVTLALLAAPVMLLRVLESTAARGIPHLSVPDLSAQGWQPGSAPVAKFKPAFEHAPADIQSSFTQQDGTKVGMYAAYYRNQDYGSKLISSNNVLVHAEDKHWAQLNHGSVDEAGKTWRAAEFRSLDSAMGSGQTLKTLSVFWVNGHWTASDFAAKIYGLLGRLQGQGDDAAVLVVYTPGTPVGEAGGANAADAALARFVRDNSPALEAWLNAVRH